MIRRLTALFMLMTIAYSSAESVIGVLRDGEVHHETMAVAALHAAHSHDSHGHEDESTPDSDHEHGTQADHCEHHHGTVLGPASLVFEFNAPSSLHLTQRAVSWTDRFGEPSVDPPRA